MKKIFILVILCALVGFTSTAVMAATEITSAGTDIGSVVYKPSPKVKVFAHSTAAKYEVVSKHKGGEKIYKSREDNPSIDESDGTKGTDITASDLPSASSN